MGTKDIIKRKSIVDKQLSKISNKIELFINIDFHFDSENDIINFNTEYQRLSDELLSITQEIKDLQDDIDLKEYTIKREKLNDLTFALTDKYYESFDSVVLAFSKSLIQFEEKIKDSQASQLTVFSIFVTIISFITTNVGIFTSNSINIENIILINLSFLTVASVLFSYIILLMKFIKRNDSFILKLFKLIGVFIFPIILIIIMMLYINKYF